MPEEASLLSKPVSRVLPSSLVGANILEHKFSPREYSQLKRPKTHEDCGCPVLNSQAGQLFPQVSHSHPRSPNSAWLPSLTV